MKQIFFHNHQGGGCSLNALTASCDNFEVLANILSLPEITYKTLI